MGSSVRKSGGWKQRGGGGGGGSVYSLCSPCRDSGVWVFPMARLPSSPGWPSPHSVCSQVQNHPSSPDSGGNSGLTLSAPGTACPLWLPCTLKVLKTVPSLNCSQDLPGGPAVKTLPSSAGVWVRSLVGELRSQVPHSQKKTKTENRSNTVTHSIQT